jgi:hypothetical protein
MIGVFLCFVLYFIFEMLFLFVSLNSFVIFFVSLPLYVDVAHLFFRCCEFTFCSYGLGCFVTCFILFLFCSVF